MADATRGRSKELSYVGEKSPIPKFHRRCGNKGYESLTLGIKKVDSGSSEGMSESEPRRNDYSDNDQALSIVVTAMFADDDNSSKWRRYSNKEYGRGITWYGGSGATRHMSNTRRTMRDYKPCEGKALSTISNQSFPVLRIS